jgi:uncharacterized protein (UPF0335 family)
MRRNYTNKSEIENLKNFWQKMSRLKELIKEVIKIRKGLNFDVKNVSTNH